MTEFVECGSVNVSYDRMGIATVTYTVISTVASAYSFGGSKTVTFAGTSFTGYVTNVGITPVSSTTGGSNNIWIAASITLTSTS